MPSRPSHTIALFGEAERGQFKKPYVLRDMGQLVDAFGNPPAESRGLTLAIQALLYGRELIFFRVEEEGFSPGDYLFGLKYLEDRRKVKRLHALYLPGVGEPQVLEASQAICRLHKSLLLISEQDFYDYLTH